MKRFILLLALLSVLCVAYAQVPLAEYVFSVSNTTYTPITGGISLGTTTTDDQRFVDPTVPAGSTTTTGVGFPIGFNFTFGGLVYDRVAINANGWISLGQSALTPAVNNASSSAYIPLSSTSVITPEHLVSRISALGRDLQAQTGASLRIETIGTAPNRELVVQWANYKKFGAGGTGDNFNFQIRLQETSNNAVVVYGPMTVNATANTINVGLRGAPANAATNYKNLTTTTSWANPSPGTAAGNTLDLTATVFPANGTTYTWAPPLANSVPNPALLVAPANGSIAFTNVMLQWASGGNLPDGYRLYFGTDGGGTVAPTNILNNVDMLNATSYQPPAPLSPSTNFYWMVIPYNTFGDATGCPIWSFTTNTPLTGTKTIGAGGNYASFTEAITDLNANGVGVGGVTFNVTDGTYSENPPAINVSGTASNPVVFQAAPGANPVLVPTGGAGTFGFKLNGVSYYTFNNIDINGPNTLIYGYWLAGLTGAGASYNTIQNCNISVPYGTTTNYGIYALGVTDGINHLNTFANNAIVGPYHGIWVTGSSTSGQESLGITVQNNNISGVRNYGIYTAYANANVSGNTISFFNGGTTAYYGINIIGANNTHSVTDNTISGGYTTSTVYGIYHSSGTGTYTGNTITNVYNTSTSGWYGIYASGGTSNWADNNIYGITNTGTAAVYTVYITTGNHGFLGNNIYDISTGGTGLYGYYVIGGTNHTIANAKVYNLRYTGTGAGIVYGIHVASGTLVNVVNNMIYDLRNNGGTTAPQVRGISITSGTTVNVYHNTVVLNASGTNANYATAAIYITATTNTIDIKNNIITNLSTPGATGRAVALWKTAAAFTNITVGSDKNIYFTGETTGTTNPVAYFGTTTYASLDDYKAAAGGRDAGSYYESAPFISREEPYDLHIDPNTPTRVEGNAIPIAGVTHDIDLDLRSTTSPDIGADEGNFTPVAGMPGNVTLIAPTDGATGINPITGQLTWSSPAEGGTPTQYWVYVATDLGTIFDESFTVVAHPNTSLTLADVDGLDVGFSANYYWAVLAHNSSGESDVEDPTFQIRGFSTLDQMAASTTLALGSVWPSYPKQGTIPVQNLGTEPLIFTANGSPEFTFGITRFVIPGSSIYDLPYTFNAPATLGAYSGNIMLEQTAPGSTEIQIAVTANVSTDVIVGNGNTNLGIPVNPYYKTTYSQSIYYPSEISYPAGYRINKIYYYFNGFSTLVHTKDFVIYMGHTTTNSFATTTSWLPISEFTQVYNNVNIAQQATGGYWMEFLLDTPFLYNGLDNLVIAVEENVLTSTYDSSSNFFWSTATAGLNRSIQHQSDTVDADPANPPTATALKAGFPNLKLGLEEIPTTPVLTVTPTAWDFGTNVINTPATRQFTLGNSGTGNLVISNIALSGSAFYSFTNLPELPLTLTTGQTANFTVQYLPTLAGTQTGVVTISDNRLQTEISLSGTCVDPRIVSLPHSQNFDAVTVPALPLGWTAYRGNTGQTLNNSTTTPHTTPNIVYMFNSTFTTVPLRLITPQITVPINTIKVSFWARTGTTGEPIKIGTVNALDGSAVFTELASIPLTTTNARYTVSLTGAGADQYIAFQHGNTASSRSIYLDTVLFEELLPVDLAATVLTAPALLNQGVPAEFNVTVNNNGTAVQNNYMVKLMSVDTRVELASLTVNTALDPGATVVHSLSWNPATAGNVSVYGKVVAAGDGNATNDNTATKNVLVISSATYIPTAGDPLSTLLANTHPFNFYWKNSVSETIYSAQEMQMTAGTIDAVIYYNNFVTNLTAMPVKLWMKNTTEANVNAAWLPFAGYTLVFDGVVNFPSGANSIVIPLTTPFAYTGDNLAVRAHRPLDTVYYSSNDRFYLTNTLHNPNRSRYINSDSDVYDPTNPGLIGTGTLSSQIPVTTFLVSNATPVVLTAPTVQIARSATNAVLSWNAVAGAYGYKIYASDDPELFDNMPVATVYTTTYTTPALAKKFFKVVAISGYRNQNNVLQTIIANNPGAGLSTNARPTAPQSKNKD